MSTQQIGYVARLASPLPPAPAGEVLTSSQWETLLAIVDTIIPSIDVSAPIGDTEKLRISSKEYEDAYAKLSDGPPAHRLKDKLPESYLAERASSVKEFKELLHRTLAAYVREDARRGIIFLLNALNTRAGCLLMTGSTTSLHLQPVGVRQQILRNWQQSYIPALRQGAKSMCMLTKSIWLKTSPTLCDIIGFPSVPVHGKPGRGWAYSFLQLVPSEETEIIETDVVIIGSGCGGGVCAKNVAEAGHNVLVVERAYYFPPEHLPMSGSDAGIHLYQNGGFESADDNSIAVLAGQAFGGGGSVNWSASLQTQGFVRSEWASDGLSFFTSSDFQDSLDRVCERMGVSTDYIEQNKCNSILLEGARKLGYSAKAVAQNTGGNKHYCGYCSNGCGAAEKQGPVVSWLPDADKAGATFMEGFSAEKILFKEMNGKKVATGVQGIWTSRDSSGQLNGTDRLTRKVVIRAKRVIVSGGSLQSPLLLLRSGLKNPQIGRNLHLHPVCILGSIYDEEIRPWEGGILTALCDELQNLDGHGHGAKLEVLCMLPTFFLIYPSWIGGLDYKLQCARFKHMAGFIALGRDRDSGRVYPDPSDGRCRIQYTPSAFDKHHVMEGLMALAKINYVAGAREIFLGIDGLSTFVREDVPQGCPDPGINDVKFQAWLSEARKKGLHAPETTFGSAHQMGTCRMGVSERSSVVDPQGQVWGTDGLFVADASVFPSASGVNPMITNMAISDWISRGVANGLKLDKKAQGKSRL